jgi:hypothetical protein
LNWLRRRIACVIAKFVNRSLECDKSIMREHTGNTTIARMITQV